jgi:hypothetical protein
VIVYTAAATLATTKEPVTAPAEIEQDVDEVEPPEPVIVQVESPGAKPEPDTVTLAPTSAELGFIVMDGMGSIIWKLAVAESPAGLPIAATK